MRILILGYYNKHNLGDDLFELAFEQCLEGVKFANLANISDINLQEYDTVIIGGGDVINKYYLTDSAVQKLASLDEKTNVIFYSFGLSFPQLVSEGILDAGHFFFPRNKHDYEFLKYRFGDSFVKYTPDMSFLLANSVKENQSTPSTERLKIGMCLPFPWFAQEGSINPFFSEVIQLVAELTAFGDVYFIPFDTSNNPMNSDLLLSQMVKNALPTECAPHVFFLHNNASTPATKLQTINDYFLNLDIVFASRFHSVIMSVLTCTPFISLYASRKIQTIIPQMDKLQSQFVSIPTNDSGSPRFIGNVQGIIELFHQTIATRHQIKQACKSIKERNHSLASNAVQDLIEIVSHKRFRYSPPQYIPDCTEVVRTVIRNVASFALQRFGTLSIRNIEKIMRENETLQNVLPKTAKSPFTQKTITEEILWQITGDPHGPYYYGLYDTVLTQQFIPQIKWIISDFNSRYKFKTPNSSASPIVINKNFQEVHRSGWQYALNNLLSNAQFPSDIIIDTYVDKTFHWNRDFYLSKKIIPYTSPWIGFIHHTFSDYNNKFNCTELLKNTAFLQSLPTCKCLIVMSKYLQKQLTNALNDIDRNVPIHVIYHPTEFVTKTFDWNAFTTRSEKTLVQIGNWLRNVFSIYRLDLPQKSIITQKAVLRNRNSDSYFLPDDFYSQTFGNFLQNNNNNESIEQSLDMCRIAFSNMHVKGLFQVIDAMENSVVQIDHLMDEQYDDLLASSIVFIDLVDASAVNTLIECIARNTPIMINPIEPVVELLGPDYPLYYSSYYEGSKLLENTQALLDAHLYLQQMDKSMLRVETFCSSFNEILYSV